MNEWCYRLYMEKTPRNPSLFREIGVPFASSLIILTLAATLPGVCMSLFR